MNQLFLQFYFLSLCVYWQTAFPDGTVEDDEMVSGDEHIKEILNRELELQIYNAINPRFLLQLV